MPIGTLIQRARKDALRFTQGAFSVELTLTPNYTNIVYVDGLGSPYVDGQGQLYTNVPVTETNQIIIQGLATRHSETIDPSSGLPMIGTNAYCTFSEKDLQNKGYATRNQNNVSILKGWLVSWQDAIGVVNYTITEPMPDSTLGLTKCLLGDYA